MRWLTRAVVTLLPGVTEAFTSFRSGEPWLDEEGALIDAHGAGMLHDSGTYYWYGSARSSCTKAPTGNRTVCGDRDAGINLYSSVDLYSWKPHGHQGVRRITN